MYDNNLHPGTHPESGLYHRDHMPLADDSALREVQLRLLADMPLTIAQRLIAGRDTTTSDLGGYNTKPDHAYRAVSLEDLARCTEAGAVVGWEPGDEPGPESNEGINWYLGGVSMKYGAVILEAPATPEYFVPAFDYGSGMAKDPRVRHMKSSGEANPIPMNLVTVHIPYRADRKR